MSTEETKTSDADGHSALKRLGSLQYGWVVADILFEPWMDEWDKNKFLETLEANTGVSIEKLNSDISIGVSNGYTAEYQCRLIKELLQHQQTDKL